MKLHNKFDKKTLQQQLAKEKKERLTLSFYQYANITNPPFLRDHLYIEWSKLGVLGRTYIAKEGINAQISLPKEQLNHFKEQLESIDFLKDCRLNIAIEEPSNSFLKLKIKVRKKIVADGLDDQSFDVTNKGIHLSAQAFNELTSQDDTVLIDMRNHYESEVGHFEKAITPDVDTFRDSLPIVEEMLQGKEDKNIVMYCTGGIRCEKASAYFKHKGFQKVYQLEGGIIEYTRQARKQGLSNKFKGKNFVFDDRLSERISDDVISKCHQCGSPCDTHVNCKNVACNLLFIQCPTCKAKHEQCCSDDCQAIIQLSEDEQRDLRKGRLNQKRYYKKGRSENLLFKK